MTNPPNPLPPHHARSILRRYPLPGIFITGTSTDVGKTTATAALAGALLRIGVRVGVCKPVSSGCPKHPDRGPSTNVTTEDFLSPDAEIIARAAGLDTADHSVMQFVSPVRFAAPVSPHLAAQIEQRDTDWTSVAAAFDWWTENCDVLLVEGAGGWLVPLDQHDFTVADLAAALRLPVIVVTDPKLGSLNNTALTVHAVRQRGLTVAGLVINHAPDHPDLAEQSNLTEIPRFCGAPLRATFRQAPQVDPTTIDAFANLLIPFATEWWEMTHPRD